MRLSRCVCNVNSEQVTFSYFFYFIFSLLFFLSEGRWHTMKGPIGCCCAATGSRRLDHFLFAARPQFSLHIKNERLGEDWERAVFVGLKEKGWIKNCLGASVFSDPNWNYKCIWEMSYLRWAVPQAGLFFPLSLWWVSRTWSDKADRRGCYQVAVWVITTLYLGALQWCCGDKGSIMRKKGRW